MKRPCAPVRLLLCQLLFLLFKLVNKLARTIFGSSIQDNQAYFFIKSALETTLYMHFHQVEIFLSPA